MSDEFERKDNHCTDRIDSSWRKPKGSRNKQRLGKKGHPKAVDTGYRTKKSERHKWNGKQVITVTSTEELDDIDADTEAARIPSMGRRKKTPLVEHAVDNDISIVNLDEDQYIEQTQTFLKERKERKERRKKEAEEAAQAEEDADETDDENEPTGADKNDETADDDGNSPTSENTVDEIKAWLDDNDIEYTSSMRKDDLLSLVNDHDSEES